MLIVLQGYEYTRCGNPIRSVLEKCLIELDHAKYALAYSTGMSAIASIIDLLRPGDHVVCSSDVYGGTYRLLNNVAKNAGVLFDYADLSDEKKITNSIKPETKVRISQDVIIYVKILYIAFLSESNLIIGIPSFHKKYT